MQERKLNEQSDGGAARSAGTGRVRSDEARELPGAASAGDADRRALADALRFLDSSDDPEPFAGQFDPFDGFRTELEQDRNVPSAAPAEQFGSIHPPSRKPDGASPRAAGSIPAEEIKRLEQEMMEIDASWRGCEPEPVSRTVGKQGNNPLRQTRNGEASGDAMPADAGAAQQPPSNQAVPESASSAAAQPAGAALSPSGGCDSETAGSPPRDADSDAATGSTPDSRPGGRDRESLRAASPEADGLDGIPGQLATSEDDPSGFGNGGGTRDPLAEDARGLAGREAENRAFDEVGAQMAIRDGAETGDEAGASRSLPQESGTQGEVRNEACEAMSKSGSGPTVPPDPARAVPSEVEDEAGSVFSRGAFEVSGSDQVGGSDQPPHRPASGLPAKAAAILAAGVAVSAGMLAFDQLDVAGRLGLAQIPDGGEDAEPHGIPEMRGELGYPRGAGRSAAGTHSVLDSNTASSIAVPARSLANGAAWTGAALDSGKGSLKSVAGADADGMTEAVERAGIAVGSAAPPDGPSAESGTGQADADTFRVAGGLETDAVGDIDGRTMLADAEAGQEEFGPPFGFPVAGIAGAVRFGSGCPGESSRQSPIPPLPERKPLPGFDPAAEGCLSECEAPEAHPNTAVPPPEAVEPPKIAADAGILTGGRLDGVAGHGMTGAVGRLDGIKPESSADGVFLGRAIASDRGVADGGAIGSASTPADANERINGEIAELRAEIGGIARSLRLRIGVIEAKLEELAKVEAFKPQSRDKPSAIGKTEEPGNGPLGTRAGMADEPGPGAATRSVPERADTYVIAAEAGHNACSSRSRPPSNAPGAEGFGCGRVLDVVSDGFGGWLVVTENAVIRLD